MKILSTIALGSLILFSSCSHMKGHECCHNSKSCDLKSKECKECCKNHKDGETCKECGSGQCEVKKKS